MGHEHHFLSRLDRVSLPHVELALMLYRDHALVRYLLDCVRLPEGTERVAISLEDPVEGPFLLVTREGRFVTCLGHGMRPGDLPVVTRAQLDGIAAKAATFRARMDAWDRLAGPRGESNRLICRIIDAGPDLSREELIAISSMQPLLAREFYRLLIEATVDAEKSRSGLVKVLKKTDKLRPAYRPLLEAHWKQFWSIGHLAVLAAMGGGGPFAEVKLERGPPEALFATATIGQGILAHAFKGAFCVAKAGKPLLAFYKQQHATTTVPSKFLEAAVALFALGARHARLRAEVRKALARQPACPDPLMNQLATYVSQISTIAFEAPEKVAAVHRKYGAATGVSLAPHVPEGSPFRFEREEDVPEELAMTLAVNHRGDFTQRVDYVKALFVMLPWAARAEPEQLYLPQDFIHTAHGPWTPEQTLAILRGWVADARTPPPRPEGPTRNGPCPCGSGKKYKRCCGAQRSA
jgi:hypothetical protein